MIRIRYKSRTARCIVHYLVIATMLLPGCAKPRWFYREQSDREAYCLIQEKSCDECRPMNQYSINPDPRSRMFDPFSLDCPPMPPDDPTSHCLMHCVDGKHGYECWHANGDTRHVQNPDWWAQTLQEFSDEEGAIRVDVEDAMRLALIHSPAYQRELEELYLSALDVSFQRFQFDRQYFAGYSGFFNTAGRANAGDSTTGFEFGTFSAPGSNSLRKEEMFADGTQLIINLANSLMWEFSGADMHAATTLLNFSLIQPLLRNGGRDIVLEALTQSERSLLANVRQMERFRRSFYVEVFAGRGADPGPARGGIGLGGLVGQTQTAGQAGGYLGVLQSLQAIRNQRANISSLQSSVAQLDAFFVAGRIDFFQVELARQALFSAQSRLLNAERALEAQLDTFKIQLGLPPYVELKFDETLIEPFQLVDPKIVPLQNRLTRLQQRVGETMSRLFARAKLPDLERKSQKEELPGPNSKKQSDEEDSRAKSDSDKEEQAEDESAGEADSDSNKTDSDKPDGDADKPSELKKEELPLLLKKDDSEDSDDSEDDDLLSAPSLAWDEDVKKQLETLRQHVREAIEAIKESRDKHTPVAKADVKKLRGGLTDRNDDAKELRDQIQQRLESEKEKRGLDEITESDIEGILPFNSQRLEKLPLLLDDTMTDIAGQFKDLEKEFLTIDKTLADLLEKGESLKPTELYERLQESVRTAVPNDLNILAATVLSLTLVQARARTESVMLTKIDTTWQESLDVARYQRLDWMNARASLVDSWRQIQFAANDLESQLDFVVEGDLGNVGDNPLDINLSNSRLRFGLQFDAPITRLQERNTFRESQINYQRSRRDFYQFEDGVAFSLRDIIRRLKINQIDFELQRAAVEVAISQVELARLRLQEPPRPNEQSSFGATTARDLVQALSGLLSAQNDFLNVWVQQEVLRRLLDLDRGTMRLVPTGIWIDPTDEMNLTDEFAPGEPTPANNFETIPLPLADPPATIAPIPPTDQAFYESNESSLRAALASAISEHTTEDGAAITGEEYTRPPTRQSAVQPATFYR